MFARNFPFFCIFLPIICGITCLPLGHRAAKRLTFTGMAALTAMSAALLVFTVRSGESFTYVMGHFPAPFGNEIRSGPLEALMSLLFCSVCFISILGGTRDMYDDVPRDRINHYFLMQNMMMGAMLAIIFTNDIFTAFVFIDIITIAACSVISAKPGGRTLAATMSYLIMSLIGSSLVLFSIAMTYSVTGHLLMPNLRESIAVLAATGEYAIPLFVLAASMTAGLAIKSALFPFHGWLPNAHASATTSASATLSGLIIKCYLVLLVKLVYRVFSPEIMALLRVPHLLLIFGAAGIVYGSWKAVKQRDAKRMLSYGSISQIGYIAAAIGLNTDAGMAAACFHIAVHAVGKAMLFTATGGLAAVSGHRKDFDSLRGAARRDPISGAAFIMGGLTLIGVPPFPGFTSKLYLASASLETPFAILVIPVVIVGSVLGAMYYTPAISYILAKNAESGPEKTELTRHVSYRAALCAFIALTLALGLFPQRILGVIEQGLAVFG